MDTISGVHHSVHLLEVNLCYKKRYYLLQHVFHDGLWVPSILYLLRHAQDVPRLPHEVVQVLVLALVRQLRQSHLLLRELVVQVKQLQGRVGKLPEHWREGPRGQSQQRDLELRDNKSKAFVFDLHGLEQRNSLRDHIEVVSKQNCLKVLGEIPWEIVSFL